MIRWLLQFEEPSFGTAPDLPERPIAAVMLQCKIGVAQMTRSKWLARIVSLPGVRQIASVPYDVVLAPAIYRWHLWRLRRQARAVPG